MPGKLILPFLLSLTLYGADAPGWLKEATTSQLPQYPAKTPAAVLLQEEIVTVEVSGKQTRTNRYVIKVLNRDGIPEASFADVYSSDTGKPRDMKAWLISPSGNTKEFSKSDITDVSASDGLYDEYRIRMVKAGRAADVDSFFGAESTIEQTRVFSQFQYDFQEDLPSLRSSFVLNVPAGWKAEGKVFRGAVSESASPEVSGNSYRWQLKNLPPWDREPGSPRRSPSRPRLVVSMTPPEGIQTPIQSFTSWKEVSVWKDQLTQKSFHVTPELSAFVQQVAPSSLPEEVRIQKLAEIAQKIRYISVQMNISRGGGYTPHTAEFVHQKKYGDCKDKSNYLRTLLKAAGIDSYMVSIFSGDPDYARPEWPSPSQFNHAILAIRVSDTNKAPASFDYPGIGRLLLFDPTDEDVPLGYIPDHEQGSYALLVAGQNGDLFQTPRTLPAQNHLSRTTRISLDAEGGLKAEMQESSTGQPAFNRRYSLRQQSAEDYRKSRERYVGYYVPGSVLAKSDQKDEGTTFSSQLEFSSKNYSRLMQNRLMMIRPFPLPANGLPETTNAKRTQPFVLKPVSFTEEAQLQLPDGFEIDELPEYPELSTRFGKYSIQLLPEGNQIRITRSLEIPSLTVSPEDYSELRDFIGQVGGSEKTPIVLVRK